MGGSDPNEPPVLRCRSRDGDVAAEAHEDAPARGIGRCGSRSICGPGLGGGAEVEAAPLGDAHGGPVRVELDPLPAGDAAQRAERSCSSRGVAGDLTEVAVVAEHPQGGTDRRVDIATRDPRRTHRERDRLEQFRADVHGLAGPPVECHELGIVTEAAAGGIDDREPFVDRGTGGVEPGGTSHEQDPAGSDPPETTGGW